MNDSDMKRLQLMKVMTENSNGKDVLAALDALTLAARVNTVDASGAGIVGDANANGTNVIGPIAVPAGERFKLVSARYACTAGAPAGLYWGTKVGAFGALTQQGMACFLPAVGFFAEDADDLIHFVYQNATAGSVNIFLYMPHSFGNLANVNNAATVYWDCSLEAVIE